jgi:hypothetical protein
VRPTRKGIPIRTRLAFKPLDIAALVAALAVIAGFSVYAYAGSRTGGAVVVEASGTQWIYPLSVDRRESVPGPLGDTIVVIKDGKASVEDSPCPDKLCVHMPAISRPGQWIACLPNRVFVRVRGGEDQGVDILSY